MNPALVLNRLIEEMRNKGSLPAMNETVLEMSRLARKPDFSTPDLAAVIMRDCGLASNLLATANSAFYAPRFPLKTVSAAVTYLGVDKVFLLSMGLGLFRHIMVTMRKRKLLKLYAISYFCGTLAMSLAKTLKHANPEELFIVGLFYRLPGMSLANTFPERFHEMESRVNEKGMTVNQACLDVFQVRYDDICNSVLALYNLPKDVKRIICHRKATKDPLILLIKESADLASMLFGDQPSGKNALQDAENRIVKILNCPKFSIAGMIRRTLETDANVKHFFNLSADDIEMMVNLLEWGKANPMEVVSHMDFGTDRITPEPVDTPEVLIGHFLTELALCRKRGGELNQMLMISQEALFRCLLDTEIFLAFLSTDKQLLQGRFYVGCMPGVNAKDFAIPMNKSDSPIVQCVQSLSSRNWRTAESGLGLPFAPFGKMPFRHAYLSPIVMRNQGLGICFAGRLKEEGFNERECIWIDQIAEHISAAFSTTRA
jgi:HD-like signal output (HDOD) protein